MDTLIDAIADILFEVRRRADTHFERVPLSLSPLDTLPAGGAARELVQAVADAAEVPTRDTHGAPPDAVGELVAACLRQACEASPDVLTPSLRRERVDARVGPRLAARHGTRPPAYLALPGLARCRTGDGSTHYLRCGSGDTALLLVNAFGLTLDIWHDLARALSDRFTVFVIDDDPPAPAEGVPRTTYATPDSLQRFHQAARAVLASEGRASCHVASWCSGAKFAIELARHWPEGVQSLMLFAPSFAGAEGVAGADSPFETSLHTLCKLVDRMPQSADSMARSMMAVVTQNASDDNDPFALADSATLPWLHAPFASAGNMVAYSRQLLNFRGHTLGTGPASEPLSLPALLVTGARDTTTSAARARDLCHQWMQPVHYELAGGSHYFIHQNSGLVADLVRAFVSHGTQVSWPHARLARVAAPEQVVSGEL